MKKILLILFTAIIISLSAIAQSVGDFRSIGNGNWNDASKWEIYNGNGWVGSSTYPGQLSVAGAVIIMKETEIKVTTSIPHPVASLTVSIDNPAILTKGVLTFTAVNAVTLVVLGDVVIGGELGIDDQIGAKTHTVVIGGNLSVLDIYDDNCICYVSRFQTINVDDKLGVTFKTTVPNSSINNPSSQYISFQDITFDGIGILVNTNIIIAGTATFINGIVRPGMKTATNGMDILGDYDIGFYDGSTVSGGSNFSYIEGPASKSGVEPFTFPMGHSGVYAPLTISGIVHPERFFAIYNRNDTWDQAITDPALFSISNCESWSLIRDIYNPVNLVIDVTVGWISATRCGSSSYISNVSEVVLTTGFSHGGTGTGTASNGSVTWSGYNHLDTWSSFTLGNVGNDCRTPLGLNSTNITANSATVSWSPVTGSVNYDVDFKERTSSTWINAATAITTTSANLSGLSPSIIYEYRVRSNCSSASSSYNLTQFTTLQPPPPPPPPPPTVCNDVYETNNTSSQAKTISVGSIISAGISSATDIDWFKVTTPNNPNSKLEITLSNLLADYDLYVYSKNLKLVGSSETMGISNEVVSIVSNGPKNTYYIKVVGKNGAYTTGQCYNLLAQSQAGIVSSRSPGMDITLTDGSNNQLLYPNPASQFVFLGLNSEFEGNTNMQVMNAVGQVKKLYGIKLRKGYNQLKVPVNDLIPGTYLLRINKAELNVTRKIIIKR